MQILKNISSLVAGSGNTAKNYTLFEDSNDKTEIQRTKHFQRQFDYYVRDTDQIKKYLRDRKSVV